MTDADRAAAVTGDITASYYSVTVSSPPCMLDGNSHMIRPRFALWHSFGSGVLFFLFPSRDLATFVLERAR